MPENGGDVIRDEDVVIQGGGNGEDVSTAPEAEDDFVDLEHHTAPKAEDDFVDPEHQDLVEEAAADHVADVQDEEPAPPTPQGPAPPTPPPAPEAAQVWTEDNRGYIRVPGHAAPIGRITSWGKSLSARCMVPGHSRCTRPYTFTSLPGNRTLPEWLIAGIGLDSASHVALPKPTALSGVGLDGSWSRLVIAGRQPGS